jgi:hypothetical protein
VDTDHESVGGDGMLVGVRRVAVVLVGSVWRAAMTDSRRDLAVAPSGVPAGAR